MWIKGSVLASAVVLALVGCSADADPKPLPPLPSVSPTPAVLPLPPEATPETSEGASAFARYYLRLLQQAMETGDPTPIRAVSDAGCGGCSNLIGAIERARAAGQRVQGAEFVVISTVAPAIDGSDVIVDLRYQRRPGNVVNEVGAVVTPIAAEPPIDAQMRVMRRGSSWVMLGFRSVSAP